MKAIRIAVWALALMGAVSAQARLNVVATLPDYGAIAEAVGGDDVTVTTIARGTEDQHFVDARPSFIRVLNKADVLIEGGAEMEIGWLPPLLEKARNKKITGNAPGHLKLAPNVQMIQVPAGAVDRSMGDVHALGNPHFSLDPANGKRIAMSIASTLSKADPEHAADYASRRDAFVSKLDAKLAEWSKRMEPFRGTRVLTYHKSYDYFLERFGLELAATIEPKPGIEPSPTHIKALIPRAKDQNVKLVIVEPFRSHKTAQYVAEACGARLVMLPGSVGANEKIKDYITLFDEAVAQIVGALKR